MGQKLIVKPLPKGLRNDLLAFNVDNDSFPLLLNAYQWRGRAKRKRGTAPLTRLQRYFDSTSASYNQKSAFITNVTQANPAVITANNSFSIGQWITINNVIGMTQLNGHTYLITAASSTSITIMVDSTGFTAYTSGGTATLALLLDGSGNGNLLTGFGLQITGNIIPGTVSITDTNTSTVYTDSAMDGTLVVGAVVKGSINYATGAIIIAEAATHAMTATFFYYPGLPVMGSEELVLIPTQFPGSLDFDTIYSYNINTTAPYTSFDVSFYKNPAADSVNLPGYVPKVLPTPTTWNGQNYQQFWTINYQGALWATNGISDPFTITNIGMQYKPIVSDTVLTATTVSLNIVAHGLVVGDFVFINEVVTTTGINFQTGYVITVTDANNIVVKFPNATIATNGTDGIAQYLTNRSDVTKDCLRWYDGLPDDGANPPTFLQGLGWVNFAPPLSQAQFSIDDKPVAQYYLVGARIIFPFKDRILFFGPVIQTSAVNSQIYLQDTIIFSQNGTPYYTASYTNFPSASADTPTLTNTFHPILVPPAQTATSPAYFEDSVGFGGFLSAGLSQPIITVANNEDVLIVGFSNKQTRLIYTGNNFVPFNIFVINSELGTESTFSVITLDRGSLTIGEHGIIISEQVSAQRIDLEIPDQVFQIRLLDNGVERVTAQRDFINEWIYFTYPSNSRIYAFPNQTLQYNYRDNSWAIFDEAFTTYGQFKRVTGETWATIGSRFATWNDWTEPWNAGASTLLQPSVIAGNQQGFVVIRDTGTSETNSLSITNISAPLKITGITQATFAVVTYVNASPTNILSIGQLVLINNVEGMIQINGGTYTITAATATTVTLNLNTSMGYSAYTSGGLMAPSVYSPNHTLNNGDFIVISGAIGTISNYVNGKIYQIRTFGTDTNNFFINPSLAFPLTPPNPTYFGGGLIKRMYRPNIQTKQFPMAWDMAQKTRIGPQQYLFTKTANGQITLQIFLSQDAANAGNDGTIVPDDESINASLIYSEVLFTSVEPNNLQMIPTSAQIWHRVNTSLIGDTVQIGFTLSDDQMRDPTMNNQFAEIELHAFVLDVSPSQVLA